MKYTITDDVTLATHWLAYEDDKSAIKRIIAPMPGKIIDIFLNEGDLVNAGEPILTLEAMKMQNEIAAEFNGVIQKIKVVPGQSVMKDELLIEIQSIDV